MPASSSIDFTQKSVLISRRAITVSRIQTLSLHCLLGDKGRENTVRMLVQLNVTPTSFAMLLPPCKCEKFSRL